MNDASPQVEDGYTRIANELLDALSRVRLPGRQWQVVCKVIRMTYGFNRKSWETSNIELSKILNMHRQHVCTDLKELVAANLLFVTENGYERKITIGIQKNYKKWSCNRKRLPLPKTVTSVTENGYESLPKTVTVPLKTNKDNSKDTPLPLAASKNGNIPYDEIKNMWNRIMEETELSTIDGLSETRKKHLKARWNYSDKTKSVDWWEKYFKFITESDFLMGRTTGRKWKASFDWVINESNFMKIKEGTYHN